MALHTYSLRVFFNIVNRNKSFEQLPKQRPVRLLRLLPPETHIPAINGDGEVQVNQTS